MNTKLKELGNQRYAITNSAGKSPSSLKDISASDLNILTRDASKSILYTEFKTFCEVNGDNYKEVSKMIKEYCNDHLETPEEYKPVEKETEEIESLLYTIPTIKSIQDIIEQRKAELEALICVAGQNKDWDNIAWLGIIAPPSSGKSFLLELFDHPYISYFVDSMTANATSAGIAHIGAPDTLNLFQEASHKNLILPDMSSHFGNYKERLFKFIGDVTTAYGHSFKTFSPGAYRKIDTSFCLMMGMTKSLYYRAASMMNQLGSRMIFMTFERLSSYKELSKEEVHQLYLKVCTLVHYLTRQKLNSFPEDCKKYARRILEHIIILRNIGSSGDINDIEGYPRILQQMHNLCSVRASIYHRDIIIDDILFFIPYFLQTIPNVNILQRFLTFREKIKAEEKGKWDERMINNGYNLGIFEENEAKEIRLRLQYNELIKNIKETFFMEEIKEIEEPTIKEDVM